MKKRIWVGLDVHAASIEVARLDGDSNVVQRSSLENTPKLVERAFKRMLGEGEVACAYEAGVCGFELQRLLQQLGVQCDVVAPSLIPRKPGERIKTDRRDAQKLARMLRAGELTAVHIPNEEQEAGRDLLRAREDAREARTAARHQLTKFLLRHGHRYAAGQNWTDRFWRWVRELRFEHSGAQLAFEHYVEQVRHLDARLGALDAEIETLAKAPLYAERVGRLSCLRGISTLSAMVILTELHDLRRFSNPRQLMAYLGVVPSEHSSGGRERRGGITKTGNAHVRRILVEASWAYRHKPSLTRRQHVQLAKQPPAVVEVARTATMRLSKRYARLAGRGKRQQVVVTAIARELAGFIWAIETLPKAA
jgi:transposase